MTYHNVKRIGIVDGATGEISAGTARYHPCKILDTDSIKLNVQHQIIPTWSQAGYDPTSLNAGMMNADLQIKGEYRDLVMLYYLLGESSSSQNGGNATDRTHTITTKTTRPDKPFRLYTEMSGGTSDFLYRWENCIITRWNIEAQVNMRTKVSMDFKLGRPSTNPQATNAPILFTTANDNPLILDSNATATWDGNDIGGLLSWMISVERPAPPLYYHKSSNERFPEYDDAQQVRITGSFAYKPDSSNDLAIFGDSISSSPSGKTLVFGLSNSSTHNVTFTLSNVFQIGNTIELPSLGGETVGAMIVGFWATSGTFVSDDQTLDSWYDD